jgi:hypothetical protein
MPAISQIRKSDKLWFCRGTSDKVYEVTTGECGGLFTVTARWGRRGGHMSEQVKVETGDYFHAATVHNSLVESKISKGYTHC